MGWRWCCSVSVGVGVGADNFLAPLFLSVLWVFVGVAVLSRAVSSGLVMVVGVDGDVVGVGVVVGGAVGLAVVVQQ